MRRVNMAIYVSFFTAFVMVGVAQASEIEPVCGAHSKHLPGLFLRDDKCNCNRLAGCISFTPAQFVQ